MRRRSFFRAASVGIVLGTVAMGGFLTGCTADSDPPEPTTSASRSATATGSPDPVATDEAFTGSETIDPIARTGNGTTSISFATPTQIAVVEIRCVGGISGAFELEGTSPEGATMTRDPATIRCDGSAQFVDSEDLEGYGLVSALRVDVRLRGVPAEFIVWVTPARGDTWAGYYDDLDTTAPGGSVSWGSFGSPDAASPRSVTDMAIEEGAHVVRVECAGPDEVTLTLRRADDFEALSETIVPCSSQPRDVRVTTPTVGLGYELDSLGRAGAFRVTIDPGDSIPAP